MGVLSKRLTAFYFKFNKLIVALLCVAVLCCSVAVFAGVETSKSKVKKYGEKVFYIVYSGKYLSTNLATEVCAQVADRGGAGVIYSVGNTKFVVANVYLDKESAKSVCSHISEVYPSADILSLSAPGLAKSMCLEIEKVEEFKQYYKFMYESCNLLYDLALSVDQDNLSASAYYKQIMQIKQKCQSLCEKLSKNNSQIGLTMHKTGLLVLEQVGNFFNLAFVNNSISKPLKKLYVNWAFEFVEMCKELKNL